MHDGISLPLRIFGRCFKNTYAAGYDSNHNLIETIKLSNSDSLENIEKVIKNNNYHYVRFCSQKDYTATAYYTDLGNISVSEISGSGLADDSVSVDKVTFIKGSQYRNLIDKSSLTTGSYINSTGNIALTPNLNATDFIPVDHEITYLYNNIRPEYYAYYDENHEFLSGYSTLGNLSGGSFTPPENAKYMRCTIHDNQIQASYIALVTNPLAYRNTLNSVIPSEFCDYEGKEISVFNKILCIGDSLTQGIFNKTGSPAYVSIPKYSYPTILHKITGVDVTNAGDSGKTFESWYANHSSDDLSGHDLCIIALGTNNNSWGDTQITALTDIINKVKTENNKIHIFVSSIIPAYSYQQSYYNAINTGIKALVDGLNDPNVKYVDLTTYGHTNDSMCFNTGHLSAYGYNRLARDYANYISFDMVRNPNDYRFVQFSNTDYEY